MPSIACDARALIGPRTGVGTVTEALVLGLRPRGFELILAGPEASKLETAAQRLETRCLETPGPTLPGTLWLHWQLHRQLAARPEIKALIATLGSAPRRLEVPVVLMVHDLTPLEMPLRHTLKNRFCFNAYIAESIERAAAVVCVSEATATALETRFPELGKRVEVLSNGVAERFVPASSAQRSPALAAMLGDRPFFLHLGTLEARKGLEVLLEAWRSITDPPELVLAGTPGWGLAELEGEMASMDRLHRPGWVDDELAVELLQQAAAVVVPSRAEGFGLPLAEALACGAPVVASAIPALLEVGGEAIETAPVGDSQALAAAITRALEPSNQARLRALALERAKALRWGPTLDGWAKLLSEICNPAARPVASDQ